MLINPWDFDPLFHNYSTECPYGLLHQAVFRQVAVNKIEPEIYEAFIMSGCRRMGTLIYRMACPECIECVPIRMEAGSVKYNKTQRKVRNKNSDMVLIVRRPEFSEEKLFLYRKFLSLRYPDQLPPGRLDYEEFFVHTCVNTWEFCYYLDGKISAVSIVDVSENFLNGVYFFFDPDLGKRSPGIYNFIRLTEYCKEKAISYFSTGFYIKNVPAMAYKAQFFPHELLIDGKWTRIEKQFKKKENSHDT